MYGASEERQPTIMKLDPREVQNISRDMNQDDSILETTGRSIDKYFQPGV